MYDLAHENDAPGRCGKCRGTGVYGWGACVNGQMQHSGPCHSCRGTGRQTVRDITRNATYNRYKIARICDGWGETGA
jgi:hypothetical protein